MSDEAKTGQLLFRPVASQEDYLRERMQKYYHCSCRCNGMPGAKLLEQNRAAQKYAKIPIFAALQAGEYAPNGARKKQEFLHNLGG